MPSDRIENSRKQDFVALNVSHGTRLLPLTCFNWIVVRNISACVRGLIYQEVPSLGDNRAERERFLHEINAGNIGAHRHARHRITTLLALFSALNL